MSLSPRRTPSLGSNCSDDEDRDIRDNPPDNITPGPAKRGRGRPPKAANSVTKKPQPKRVRSTKTKKVDNTLSSEADDDVCITKAFKIVLFVPTCTSDADQRLTVQSEISFEDLIDLLHTTIGCLNVQRKPSLQYKLSTSTQKSRTISLQSIDDWDGCIDEVQAVDKKKSVTVQITVPEQYMTSLRHTVKGSKKTAANSKARRNAMPLMDLDNENDEDEDGDDGGFMEREKSKMVLLDSKLSQCVACGPSKFCKIDKSGRHHHLTFLLRKMWSSALAADKHGVMLDCPPKDELFGMFFKSIGEPSIPVTPAPPAPQVMAPFMYPPYYPPPGLYPGYNTPDNHASSAGSHKRRREPSFSPVRENMMSSDPFEESSYQSIILFLEQLDQIDKRRDFERYKDTFESKDYFQIDEIAHLSADTLTGPGFGMSAGNADFFLKALGKKIRKTRERIQADKKARRS
ncbi:hypothetical protein C8J56DRAFT_1051238 [Mycena floridula]|nr:hypothetical protein C8J56DRAFT_1051238 [Mycena floridula]